MLLHKKSSVLPAQIHNHILTFCRNTEKNVILGEYSCTTNLPTLLEIGNVMTRLLGDIDMRTMCFFCDMLPRYGRKLSCTLSKWGRAGLSLT